MSPACVSKAATEDFPPFPCAPAHTRRRSHPLPVSWRISEGTVHLESDEQATLDEWESAVSLALGSGDYRPGMGLLHDARRMERVPGPQETRVRVWFLKAQTRAHNVARWATVVAGPAHLGMGQLAEALTDQLVDHERSVVFRVFTETAEAEVWLRERPPPG